MHHPDFRGEFKLIGTDDDESIYICWHSHTVVKLQFCPQETVQQTEILYDLSPEDASIAFGYRLSAFWEAICRETLKIGANLEKGLDEIFGPTAQLRSRMRIQLDSSGRQTRYFRVLSGAIVQVEIGLQAELLSYRFWTGFDAAVLFLDLQPIWTAPFSRKGERVAVGSWGEAILVVLYDGGRPQAAQERWEGESLTTTILGETKEGPRRWSFHISDRANLAPAYLGERALPALDPAAAILLARRVLSPDVDDGLVDREQLRENGVALLEKWLVSLPPEQVVFPEEYLTTATSKWFYQRYPDRFTRSHFQSLIRSLLAEPKAVALSKTEPIDDGTIDTDTSPPIQNEPKENGRNTVQPSEPVRERVHPSKEPAKQPKEPATLPKEPDKLLEKSAKLPKEPAKLSEAPVPQTQPRPVDSAMDVKQAEGKQVHSKMVDTSREWNSYPSDRREMWMATLIGAKYCVICLLIAFPTIFMQSLGDAFPIVFMGFLWLVALVYVIKQWPSILQKESEKYPKIRLHGLRILLPTLTGETIEVELDDSFWVRCGQWESRGYVYSENSSTPYYYHYLWIEICSGVETKALIFAKEGKYPTQKYPYPSQKFPMVGSAREVRTNHASAAEIATVLEVFSRRNHDARESET